MLALELADAADEQGFRQALRYLVHKQIPADAVCWQWPQAASKGLFAPARTMRVSELPEMPPLSLPRWFADLARVVVLHASDERFERLHRFAMRLVEERAAAADPLDPDHLQLTRMASAVRRDMHKMTAFVRFTRIAAPHEQYVAWFEPAHQIVRAVAPFFVKRFAQMHWAILTPRGSLEWDGSTLHHGPPADPAQKPADDEGQALWLAYYRSIFNPARLKVAMMKREMPVRFWKNLPEATQISGLIAQARQREAAMIEAPGTVRSRARGELVAAPRAAASQPTAPQPMACHPAAALPTLPQPEAITPEILLRAARRCDRCPLAGSATQIVWGRGEPGARLMIVGEQPGDREDLEGKPFVGPAGKLLERALAQLGWPAQALYLTNALKHFKFELRGKRRIHKTPAQREFEACAPWLEAEIDLIGPRAFIALGATAARALLSREVAIGESAGRWFTRADGRRVLVAYHPAALLRSTQPLEQVFGQWVASLGSAGDCLLD